MEKIYVPTYNKTEIPIVKMLDLDSNLEIVLCIRDEEKDKYNVKTLVQDKIKNRLNILNLGRNIHDLGETRKRIVQHCIDMNERFCIMLDDGLVDINNLAYSNMTNHISTFLYDCRQEIHLDELSDLIFAFTFRRKTDKFIGVSESDRYLCGLPLQAVIINVDCCRKNDLNYTSMSICGLEDTAFMIDGLKKGLITIGTVAQIEGKLPNTLSKGGSHIQNESEEAFEFRRDIDNAKLRKYIGDIYGVEYTKKYRESLGFSLQYCRIDFEYFRDVLIKYRKHSKKLIETQFKIDIGESYEN